MTQLNPEIEAKCRDSLAKQGALTHLGVQLARIGYGDIELTLPFSDKITQQHGFGHAGCISAVLDSACGFAALTTMPLDSGILTIEFKVNLLAPAKGEYFRMVGRVRKTGRTIVVAEADAYAVNGGQDKLIATMTATTMVIVGREGVRG
jgi:uncharacterized protein (TIGR00369 family)